MGILNGVFKLGFCMGILCWDLNVDYSWGF